MKQQILDALHTLLTRLETEEPTNDIQVEELEDGSAQAVIHYADGSVGTTWDQSGRGQREWPDGRREYYSWVPMIETEDSLETALSYTLGDGVRASILERISTTPDLPESGGLVARTGKITFPDQGNVTFSIVRLGNSLTIHLTLPEE